MFKRIFGAAFAAGIVAGLLISAVQEFTTTPIILHAEEYEQASAPMQVMPVLALQGAAQGAALGEFKIFKAHSSAADGDDHADEAWGPADGLERSLYTAGTNITLGIAFALMLGAAFAVHGGEIDGRRGVIWGLAGFAVFALAPGLGLPPEVPGSMAADLGARQMWWLGCAAATAVGLGLMVFGQRIAFVVLGLVVVAAPHIIGAPQPPTLGGAVPPELAGHFAAASLVVQAIFWAMLGWFSGTFTRKFDDRGAVAT